MNNGNLDLRFIEETLSSQTKLDNVRISVANLVSDIKGVVVGILNKRGLEMGQRNISCMGGAALLHQKKEVEKLGGFDFEGKDARFKLPISNIEEFINELGFGAPWIIEEDPLREVFEELSEEILPGVISSPILTKNEVESLGYNFRGVMFNQEKSTQDNPDLITLYIWRYFGMVTSKKISAKMLRSSAVFPIHPRTINNGKTWNGETISSNILLASKLINNNKDDNEGILS